MRKTSCWILSLILMPLSLWAQVPSVIPQPQEWQWKRGGLALDDVRSVFLSSPEDAFAAGQLLDEWPSRMLRRPKAVMKPEADLMLVRVDEKNQMANGLSADILAKMGDEGYVLEISPEVIVMQAQSQRGMFYAVQTLRQLMGAAGDTLKCLRIVDWPALQYRGWQDDISRGPIPTLEFLKDQIRIASRFKLNFMTLYTEHVFKLRSHPDIAPDDGITAEELAELQCFAKDYHVEVVGNFQSFGHFYHILKLPQYAHLRETKHVISPAVEESYKFLGEAFSEVAQAYESPLFNINCDETFGLGTGPAREMKRKLGKAGLYAYHINRVYELFKPYNKRLMMWGDIARDYPAIIPKLPQDLIVLPWAYHAAASFKDEIEPFTRSGFDFMVCPGVSCWRNMWPEFDTAIANIAHFVRDGAAMGAMGMLNTSWDDDGENLFNAHWLPLVWGGEMAWKPLKPEMKKTPPARLEAFTNNFGQAFYGLGGPVIPELFFALSGLRKFKSSGNLNNSAFWAPLVSEEKPWVKDAAELSDKAGRYASAFEALALVASRHSASLRTAAMAARRIELHADLNQLRDQIFRLQRGEGQSPAIGLEQQIDTLAERVRDLKEEYMKCWLLEARPWWLEKNSVKYDELARSLEALKSHVVISVDAATLARSREVTLTPLFNADDLYYTIDGSEVTRHSDRYFGPFTLNRTATITVRAVSQGKLGESVSKRVTVYDGPVQNLTWKKDPEKQYSGRGAITLLDGVRGDTDFREGCEWLGFWYWDFDAVLDLGAVKPVTRLGLGCLQASRSWIHYPDRVIFEGSVDGVHFEQVAVVENNEEINRDGVETHDFMTPSLSMQARYIRIKAENMGVLPDWHKSAGGKSWIFVDEVIVR